MRIFFRLEKGLSTLGVLNAMRSQPQVMKRLFVRSEEQKLDAMGVEDFFQLSTDAWSAPGNVRYNNEKRALTHWRDFLQDMEGTILSHVH